jgi:hypothetical protein
MLAGVDTMLLLSGVRGSYGYVRIGVYRCPLSAIPGLGVLARVWSIVSSAADYRFRV